MELGLREIWDWVGLAVSRELWWEETVLIWSAGRWLSAYTPPLGLPLTGAFSLELA